MWKIHARARTQTWSHRKRYSRTFREMIKTEIENIARMYYEWVCGTKFTRKLNVKKTIRVLHVTSSMGAANLLQSSFLSALVRMALDNFGPLAFAIRLSTTPSNNKNRGAKLQNKSNNNAKQHWNYLFSYCRSCHSVAAGIRRVLHASNARYAEVIKWKYLFQNSPSVSLAAA